MKARIERPSLRLLAGMFCGLLVTSSAWAQMPTVAMFPGIAKAGDCHFLDAGQAGDYQPDQHTVLTLFPAMGNSGLRVVFDQFQLGTGDTLTIHDGRNAASPILATGTLESLGGHTMQSTETNADGCLTFVFTSNDSVEGPGWQGTITNFPQAHPTAVHP
ncbi:MAG: hypothetical protein ABI373_04420, partial [Flavobacteriales bacterium]